MGTYGLVELEVMQLERELTASKADRVAISQKLSDALDTLFASNKQLAEARAEVEHWKGECSDLVRMAHEMRAEIDYFQTLIDLQHKRTVEADKLWQQAHNQPNVWPDLGMLVEWLMKRADEHRCCYNCKHGPKCGCGATVCIDCKFAMNNPADGKMKWETKL